MTKPNPLLDHLLNRKHHDSRDPIIVDANPNRLVFSYFRNRGDWNTVASYIAGLTRWPVTWFPDANVAFLDAAAPVWHALRVAALGEQHAPTVISGVVEAEMKEWLDDPYRNKERAADIKAALNEQTWIRRFRIPTTHPLNAALYNYTHLLGFRRSLARPCPDGTTLVDTDATNKSDTMNAIRNKLGARAQALAKKGRNEAEEHGYINISDELHCLMAILYALENRQDTVILTADADYLEIFYKA
jgi:hypothetical protein